MWKYFGDRPSFTLSRCVWWQGQMWLRERSGWGVVGNCPAVVNGGAAYERKRIHQVVVDPDVACGGPSVRDVDVVDGM